MDSELLVANRLSPACVLIASFERTLVAPETPELLNVSHRLLLLPLMMWNVLQELASAVSAN